VASTLSGDDRICAGVLPAGRYASLSNLARFAVDRQAIMSAVRLQLLGPPRAWRDEQSLAFKTRTTLALLAYLAAERGLHPRGQLAALLWPDRAEAEARNSLRSALVYLRQALGDADAALAVTRETVGLSLPLPHPRHTGAGPSPAPGPPARDGAGVTGRATRSTCCGCCGGTYGAWTSRACPSGRRTCRRSRRRMRAWSALTWFRRVLAEAFDYNACVALSADGAYLAAGTSKGEVRLWRVGERA